MLWILARAALTRHRGRTLLAIAGVAISAAMLLDMVMLATGMRESFRSLLETQGFELRLAPKGTLPLDTEATLDSATALLAAVARDPEVVHASPVLAAQLHVERGAGTRTAFALGVDPHVQGDYEVVDGTNAGGADGIVASAALLAAVGARLGDTLDIGAGFDPQLRSFQARRRLVVRGRARFRYLAGEQRALALPLATLQGMLGDAGADRISLAMAKTRPGAADRVARRLEAELPRVSVVSTARAMAQFDERLAYFRQLAFILGSVSLVVGFLLVTTLVTVSVNERTGEIAVLRAIGVRRGRIVAQIIIEGLVIMLLGTALGLLLGLATARWLNAILADFPGLPDAIDFFLFQPRAAWTALGMLVASGLLAGLYPSWRGASLPIATTLRRDAIG